MDGCGRYGFVHGAYGHTAILPGALTIVKDNAREAPRMDLMGAQEVAELLGVSRQRVHQLAERPDFPRPVATLAAGKIWRGEDVRAWAARHRKPIDEE